MLFADGSADEQTGIGYGAYLLVDNPELPLDLLKEQVIVRRFENTSSSRLEIQTLNLALGEIQPFTGKIRVYSDSQNIISLPERRERLEKNNFRSKGNRLLKNAELYQEFYQKTDHLNIEFVKVSGHMKTLEKNSSDLIFTLVDRASRKALRMDRGELK
ncbi:MAG: ribonuclease H [Bacteroidia bacterium]|nr:ribonuclease H [Bacteroidia bacterium]